MGNVKAVLMELEEGLDGEMSDEMRAAKTIDAAQVHLAKACLLLTSHNELFQGTNLSVAEAVDHVLKCLQNDSEYLGKLSKILSDSAPVMFALDSSPDYETRVRRYEAQGMTRSDAQGVVDAEDIMRERS